MRRSILALTLAVAAPLVARYTFFSPKGSFTVEVSLENSAEMRLPMYRNAITSLDVVGDYAIGGTSADAKLTPFLFAVSLSKRRLEMVYPLERLLKDQRSIQSGFGRGKDGILFAGTMPQGSGQSGHLIGVRVRSGELAVEDFGVPVAGEGVFALTCDPKRGVLYGVTHPSGKFFAFRLEDRRADVYEATAVSRRMAGSQSQYAIKPEDYLSRRLVLDSRGRVYGSRPVNKLFRFDPETKQIETLPEELPEVWGRNPLGRVDAWAAAPDGSLYGGNAGDGQLFRLDPDTGRVTNLGKPAMMPRLQGLAFDRHGALWGVTGAPPGYTHLFRYSPDRGFVDHGNPNFPMAAPGLEQGIAWRGFHIGTVAVSEDGRYVVLGETEALSQLMVFPVD